MNANNIATTPMATRKVNTSEMNPMIGGPNKNPEYPTLVTKGRDHSPQSTVNSYRCHLRREDLL